MATNRVKIHFPNHAEILENLNDDQLKLIRTSINEGVVNTFQIERVYNSEWGNKRNQYIFNPAMITMVEIEETIDGES